MSETPSSSLRWSVTRASQFELHAVLSHLEASCLDLGPLGRSAAQDRLGVVDVHEPRPLRAGAPVAPPPPPWEYRRAFPPSAHRAAAGRRRTLPPLPRGRSGAAGAQPETRCTERRAPGPARW